MRQLLSFILLCSGALLLLLNLVGLAYPVLRFDGIEQEPLPPLYRYRDLEVSRAIKEFNILRETDLPAIDKAKKLFELVHRSYIHVGESAYQIQAWDNWYLWLLGFFRPDSRVSQDVDFLWKRGGGFCDQAAMIFACKAKELGLTSQLVWLDGHVIAEVSVPPLPAKMVDPDLGIFWDFALRDINHALTADKIQRELEQIGFSSDRASRITAKYTSTEDNKVSTCPYLPALFELERFSLYPKWGIPSLFLILGLALRVRRSVIIKGT